MSYVSDELGMTIMEVGDPADLTTISDALERIEAYAAAIDKERANIKALLGNVGKDSGGSMLIDGQTARANLGASSASSIASVESSTAAASHAKDSHFMLNDTLRKATSAIAAGESITNNNSTTDTIQGQIDTLRDSVVYAAHQVIIEEIPAHGNAEKTATYAPPTGYTTLAVVIESNWRTECISEVQYFGNDGTASFDVRNFESYSMSNVDIRARWIYVKQ